MEDVGEVALVFTVLGSDINKEWVLRRLTRVLPRLKLKGERLGRLGFYSMECRSLRGNIIEIYFPNS